MKPSKVTKTNLPARSIDKITQCYKCFLFIQSFLIHCDLPTLLRSKKGMNQKEYSLFNQDIYPASQTLFYQLEYK